MGVLHEAFKIAHIYTFFDEKFYRFEAVSYYDFGILSDMRVLCRAKILPQIYTRIIASLEPPPYTRIICEKNFAPDIYENCGAFGICARDWFRVGILAFVCVTFYICGYRLKKIVFVDWSMSKFDCKSVMKIHKFIVKRWLCICNCMCICVCMWRWLWLVVVLIR